MPQGFFTPLELNRKKAQALGNSNKCGACGLFRQCESPKMKFHGKGLKKILAIGEAPGGEEDEKNEQFVGKAGKRLERELKPHGIILNRDCWKTNALRCRPPGNKTPNSKQIRYCRPALFSEIKRLKPEHILLFGGTAAEAVLGHIWKGGSYSLERWTDWVIPLQEFNCWVSVLYHPSYLLRKSDELLNVIFRRVLKKALQKRGRPWNPVPDYENEIDVIYKPSQVVKALQNIKTTFAFDYEANCLKPEYPGARIYSCSVSDGKHTYAYPWIGEAIEATSIILRKPIPKIASNIKFEERWTRFFLGHGVRGWNWDTMLAAHTLNNATGVSGLKFQSFVKLGLSPYNLHIEPYLRNVKGQYLNRIHEIPLQNLLIYNGMDSKLEHIISVIQKGEAQWQKKKK